MAFEDDNHTMHTGMLLGLFAGKGINAQPTVDQAGNYEPVIQINMPLDPEIGSFIPVYVRVLASEGFE